MPGIDIYEPYDRTKYIGALARFLNKYTRASPKDLTGVFDLREQGSNLLGWDFDHVRVHFDSENGYMDLAEVADVRGDHFSLVEHHYQFGPHESAPELRPFRIDKHRNGEPHVNTDGINGLPAHAYYPTHHRLDIRSFNAVLALIVAYKYSTSGSYPVEKGNEKPYNDAVRGVRSMIK